MTKKLKIQFAPGCFDDFDGTQEELDGLIGEIQRLADSGELFEKCEAVNFQDPDETDMEIIEHLIDKEKNLQSRKLQ